MPSAMEALLITSRVSFGQLKGGVIVADAQLTTLIKAALSGDDAAHDAVFETAYQDLKRLAHARVMRSGRKSDLDTTGLVHESYLRFVKSGQIEVTDRAHFFGYVGRVMRSVIIDAIREGQSLRRGGDAVRVTVSNQADSSLSPDGAEEVLAVHAALDDLRELDEALVQVVELRYFAGMTETEIAEALDISDRTVRRRWNRAKLWLADALASH